MKKINLPTCQLKQLCSKLILKSDKNVGDQEEKCLQIDLLSLKLMLFGGHAESQS